MKQTLLHIFYFISFYFKCTQGYLLDIEGLSEAKGEIVLHTQEVVYVWVEGRSCTKKFKKCDYHISQKTKQQNKKEEEGPLRGS